MRYALLICSTTKTRNPAEDGNIFAEDMSFSREIIDSGEMVGGDPLQGVESATCVRVRGGNDTTAGGPCTSTDETL